MKRAPSPKIVVGPNDSMPDVLTRLRTATGGPASLAIPASSSLFLTASEFRALKAASDQARITLTVETDDRLRKQLATMFQIPVIDLLPSAVIDLEAHPAPADEPDKPAETPKPLLPELPKLNLPPAIEVTPKWEPRKPDEGDEADDKGELPVVGPKRELHLPWKWIGIGAGALVLVGLIGFITAYLLQTATITITLKRQQVSAGITYAVVSPGAAVPAGALFSINASPITMSVPYQQTIPVTGVLREPDQIATGKVALRNPTDQPVTIAKGTTFKDRNGIEYAFTQDITVPAADNTNGPGRAEAAITASTGGEDANRDSGMLSGKLDNGVYYSNRDAPVAGGTDKKTPIVAQADIDKLVAEANAGVLRNAVSTPLSDGRSVLPGSLQPGELSYTVSQKVGDQVDSISIDATMVVSGMAFQPSDAETPAKQQLQSDLQAKVPSGYELEPESITYAPPVLVNDQGQAGLYKLTATANAKVIVDDPQKKTLAHDLSGKSVEEAKAYLRQQPFVADFAIDTSPSFLPERIPSSAGRITVKTK